MTVLRSNAMLNRFLAFYGPPRRDESDARQFLAEFARHVDRFTSDEMNAAVDRIIESRRYTTWPTVAECVATLRTVREANTAKVMAEARKLQQRQQALPEEKRYTEAELTDARKFVDMCAAGEIDMGLCHAALQKLAKTIQVRRAKPLGSR